MNATRDTTRPTFDATVTRHNATHDTTSNATAGERVTITEAAQRLGVSVRTVQRRLDSGDLEYQLDHKYKRLVVLPREVPEAPQAPGTDATGNATHDTTERDSDVTRRDKYATRTGADDTRLGRLEGYQMAQFEQRLQAGMAQAVQLATAPLLEMLREQRDEMRELRAHLDRLEAAANITKMTPEKEPVEAPQAALTTNTSQTDAAPKQSPQRGAQRPKPAAWQRAIMRALGVRLEQ
jgi:hypothetical protein